MGARMLTGEAPLTPAERAGVQKRSFAMPFGGGAIWFEHLDGIGAHEGLALEKLQSDSERFRVPSAPSMFAVNLEDTRLTPALTDALARQLLHSGKRLLRVVFVGVDQAARRRLETVLSRAPFSLGFFDDFEKAKEWLIPISRDE